MVFRALGLCVLLLSVSAFAQGRKPAVEDFVGIEVDHPEVTPQGTEPLFNLEQDLTKHAENVAQPELDQAPAPQATNPGWSLFSVIGLAMGTGLPLIVWLMIMSHMRKKASLESASNIEVLEKYRKERQQNKKSEEKIRKVS